MHVRSMLSVTEQVVFIGLVALSVLGVACGLIRANAHGTESRVVERRGVQTVSAEELFVAYNANEIAADARFKGRRLRVSGSVASIDKTFFGSPQLQLATPDGLDMAIVLLERSETDAAATLEKGQRALLLCTGHGKHLGFVSLGDCTLQ